MNPLVKGELILQQDIQVEAMFMYLYVWKNELDL